MHKLATSAGVLLMLMETGSTSADMSLAPGLYAVEVRISLPNVQDVARPLLLEKCITAAELESGHAFFVLSDNPLKTCDLVDYEGGRTGAIYRIVCPGPNRGSAVGVFEFRESSYRGTIKMNMGGKNMTMSETQVGKRVGECP